jgi:hypothetical protein
VLLQNADDLFARETVALHSLVLSMGRVVGNVGETSIRVVVKIDEKGLITNNIITAHPE